MILLQQYESANLVSCVDVTP